MARACVEQLLYLASVSPDPITVYVNSGGGSVSQVGSGRTAILLHSPCCFNREKARED